MTREEKAQFCIDNAKTTPAFQFYPNDWFGSRHVAAMNSSQRGIHATLIFAAWLEPTCGIPKGEECLTARVLESEIDDCLKVLSWCWFLYENLWFCERVLNERIKQIKLSFLRTEVGSKGGRPIKSRTKNKKPIDNQKDSKAKAKITKSEYEKEKENEEENKDIKHKYGEYKHVLLADKEYEKLRTDYGDDKLKRMIKNLDEGIELKGYKYKNHNLALRKWESKTAEQIKPCSAIYDPMPKYSSD